MEESDYYKIPKRLFRNLLLILPVVLIVYALVKPMYGDYTDRARTNELIALAEPAKIAIAAAIAKGTPIKEFDKKKWIQQGQHLTYMHITDSGEIFSFGESFGTFVKLTPIIKGKEVSWVCIGQPQKNMPMSCRHDL